MIVTVLDTVTGERVVKEGISAFDWAYNNWSCDCNRRTLFDIEDDTESEANICIGGKRFPVVDAQFEADDICCPLKELNEDYPEALLKEHLPES
jgi:hypothetical protein